MSKKLSIAGLSSLAGIITAVLALLYEKGASDAVVITALVCVSVIVCVYLGCQTAEDMRLKPLQQQPVDPQAIIAGVVAKLSENKT